MEIPSWREAMREDVESPESTSGWEQIPSKADVVEQKEMLHSPTTISHVPLIAHRAFNDSDPNDPTVLSNSLLAIPQGKAIALPSIQVEEEEVNRRSYGGKGDKKHLGGFTEIDHHGISPETWNYMRSTIGVKSVLDIGCGRGISTSWFLMHGINALCVEGSHDAYVQSMLPSKAMQMVEHDFSRGPWWPEQTYDAVWCVEFLEHVGRNFHKNYIPAMRKAALLFVTHSNWGGFHHVEVHRDPWWITKFEMYGFRYSTELTDRVRDVAKKEASKARPGLQKRVTYNAQHVWLNMMVFINPAVAILPQHAHLMAEPGCFVRRLGNGKILNKHCGTGRNADEETALPESFKPVESVDPKKDQRRWEEYVKERLGHS